MELSSLHALEHYPVVWQGLWIAAVMKELPLEGVIAIRALACGGH